MNAFFEKGFSNPIDVAICSYKQPDVSGYQKADEVPYDFIRKRLTILVVKEGRYLMVTKGTLPMCLHLFDGRGSLAVRWIFLAVKQEIHRKFETLSNKGFRLLGIAYRDVGTASIDKKHEASVPRFSGSV